MSPGAIYRDLAAGHTQSARINLEIAKRARGRGDTHEQIEALGLVFTHCLRAAAYMGYAEEEQR